MGDVQLDLAASLGLGLDAGDEVTVGHRDGLVVTGDRDVEDRLEEAGLVAERLVDRLDRHPGIACDLPDRRRGVALGEEPRSGGLEHGGTVLPRLRSAPTRVVTPDGCHIALSQISFHSVVSVTSHCI